MKTFDQIREGFVSAAQRKAVWASKADGGKGHPDNKKKSKKEDSDAVKAFLAKGGKIKKLPPAKAQGYHGKDDPGKGMHGMMDKPDTKAMGTRKKVKSMESLWDNIRKRRAAGKPKLKPGDKNYPKTLNVGENFQVQKYTDGKKDGPPKSFGGDLKKATAHASKMGGDHRVHKEANKETDPPFDDAKKISTTPTKDQFGNVIKNRAKSLARAAAKTAGGDMGDKQKKESLWDNIRKRRAAGKPKLKPGDKNYPKTLNIENTVNELDYKTMSDYHSKAKRSYSKAQNSAVASHMRGTDTSKDVSTIQKRRKGMALAKSRTIKKMRGDK